ncbi:hypothetical protein BGX26_008749, partial [Mortierella sp. AD094]
CVWMYKSLLDSGDHLSSAKDTRHRTHRMKKLHGMLPTMNSMHARNPSLYPDAVCRVCDIQDEDNSHVWICSAISDMDHTIWSEALDRIDAWGNAATRAYNKEKTNQYERALANRKPNVKQPIPVQWVCPAMEDHYKGLSCIGGTQSLLICEGTFDRSTDLKWSISDLYLGITPYNGPRGPWSDGYGYICRDGDCPCGLPLQDHTDNKCPDAQLDPHVADATLLQCLKGMRK